MNVDARSLCQMLKTMWYEILEMVFNKARGQTFAFALCLKLGEETLFNITGTTADRIKLHHTQTRFLGRLDRAFACLSHLIQRR